jgi:GxxExxY protein
MVYELSHHQIPFERQKTIQVHYKDHILGKYRLDLVIDSQIILELKAVSELTDLFKQQLLSYLKSTGLRLGILINFGAKRVESVRVLHK